MRSPNAEAQKRWREKRNELAKWALDNKREVFTAEEYARMKEEVAALRAENAGLRRRITQMEAQAETWTWGDEPADIARVMKEGHPQKARQVFEVGLALYQPPAPSAQAPRAPRKRKGSS